MKKIIFLTLFLVPQTIVHTKEPYATCQSYAFKHEDSPILCEALKEFAEELKSQVERGENPQATLEALHYRVKALAQRNSMPAKDYKQIIVVIWDNGYREAYNYARSQESLLNNFLLQLKNDIAMAGIIKALTYTGTQAKEYIFEKQDHTQNTGNAVKIFSTENFIFVTFFCAKSAAVSLWMHYSKEPLLDFPLFASPKELEALVEKFKKAEKGD